jgi:putative hydrolase
MAGSPPGFGLPFGEDPERFKDAPLFQELQRVMAASSGPVNWEIARQVAIASAVEEGEDPEPGDADRESFDAAVRVAELHVARFTGLEPPGDVPQVTAVRRATWVSAEAERLRPVLEPAAQRVGEAMDRATREQLPDEMAALGAVVGQLSPLLMGTQIGTVLGSLARRVLGQFDVAVPRGGPPTLAFVVPNISTFERSWSVEATDFRTWVALHEVTHRFEFAQPWVPDRFRALLDDFLSTLTIDLEAMQSRLTGADLSDPEGLRQLMESDQGMFGTDLDDEQRLKLGRIQAFMAAAEGYGDHVTDQVGRQLLGTYPQISEAMRRYGEEEPADPVFERLLGIEMKRERYDAGRSFCDTVVELTDEATLSRMWESPESMPSLPEIEEPRLWLARTV